MNIPIKLNHSRLQNIILWLLITSGPIKPVFEYFKAPFDWTLLVFLLVFLDIVFTSLLLSDKVKLGQEKLLSLFFLLCFTAYLWISVLYSPSEAYSIEKALLFGVNILVFLYPLFIFKIDIPYLYRLYLFLIVPIVVWFIVYKHLYYLPSNSGHQLVRIEFYDIRNKYLGLGMVIAFFTLIQVHLKKPAILLLLPFLLLLGLGSRGSLIFLLLTLFIWKWKDIAGIFTRDIKLRKRMLRVLLPVLILLVPFVYLQLGNIIRVLYTGLFRFESLISFGSDVSSQGRIERVLFAIESIFTSVFTFLFGSGFGSFGILYVGSDIRDYAHNLLLEVWFEMGLLGLVLLIAFLLPPWYYKRPTIYKVLVLCFLLHAMKSGDLVGLWILFLCYGILIFNPRVSNG